MQKKNLDSLNTLKLNSSYEPLGIISWRKAVELLYTGEAEVVKEWDINENKFINLEYDKEVSNFDRKYVYRIPAVIKYVEKNPRPLKKDRRVAWSKINIKIRDNFQCQYCGYKWDGKGKPKKLTIDHILPQDKGGKNTYDNCVAACEDCNSEKENKTLEESGMKLLRKPFVPTANFIMKMKISKVKLNPYWEPYLEKIC
jgi:5-methylcytosine-specific restriction endonuclease McrA